MASRYKAYPEYHDSGVKWLGDYPAHWKLWPCRSLVNNRMDKNEGAKDQNYLSLMANIGVIRYEDKGDVGNKKPDDLTKCKIVKVGDLVINSMNYAIGSYGMSPYTGVCSPVYIVLRCIDSVVHRRFALRLFENKPFQKHLATFGNGILEHRAAIGWDDIKGSYVPVPPQSEQLHILKFLDHETGKIDALIEKQQALIALLQEKRQAVISHAVTKGLNPDAKMKDSGVEWLGDVPEHWIVSKFAYVKTVLTDYTANGSFADLKKNISYIDEPSYARLVRLTDLRKNLENPNGVWIDEKAYKYLSKSALFGGEFLMANVGAYAGLFYQMPETKEKASLAPNMMMAKFNSKKLSGAFMAYVGQSSGINKQLVLSATAASAQPKLNKDDFKSVRFTYPTISEQLEICAYLDDAVEVADVLIEKAESAIELMKERRTALISAAVTGKIDVRSWMAPEVPVQKGET